MNRDEIIAILSAHRADLSRVGVRSLSVFGSVARGEAGLDSDVDLLVDLERPIGLFAFIRLQMQLEAWLGRSVDLVTPEGLRPELRDRVLREAVRAA